MTDLDADGAASLDLPPRTDLPLFAYGLLKPGEPAYHDLLEELVADATAATLDTGALRYRDGLPLLDADSEGGVAGAVLRWAPRSEQQAYSTVSAFASRHQHRWLATDAVLDTGHVVSVNVLRGRRPRRGSSSEQYREWSGASEPAFRFALPHVRAVALADASGPFPQADADDASAWSLFYRLHRAYLLLWAILERFALLAFGPALPPMSRLDRLDDDPRFRACAVTAGVRPSPKLADNADPYKRVKEDGGGAVYCWHSLRDHLGHPGRSAALDGTLVRRALVELHDTVRLHLADRLPGVTAQWERIEPEAAPQRWLLRPLVSPDGLA